MILMDNPVHLKKQILKRHQLLRRVRRAGSSGRLPLARELGISNSRVCDLVTQMLDEKLLCEPVDLDERRGRRGVPLELNPDYGHLLGFDLEAKRMRLVLVDFTGRIVWRKLQRLTPPKTRQVLIDRVLRFIDKGLEEVKPITRNLLGIGLACPGVVDVQRGVILHYDLIDVARDIPLRDLVASRTNLPCVLEDNIRALTLAEWMGGAAQHLHSFVCLAVRSGIGAGIVIEGKLFCGSHGHAGEVGHMVVPVGQRMSQWKQLQQIVSEHALGVDVESKQFDLPESVAKRAGQLLGAQLGMIATLLNPQAILLAGGLLKNDGPLWPHVERAFRRTLFAELSDRMPLLAAQLGPYAAAVGAAHRCFESLYPTEPVAA